MTGITDEMIEAAAREIYGGPKLAGPRVLGADVGRPNHQTMG